MEGETGQLAPRKWLVYYTEINPDGSYTAGRVTISAKDRRVAERRFQQYARHERLRVAGAITITDIATDTNSSAS